MSWVRFLGAFARRLWLLLGLLIITYAVVVVLGREFLPQVSRLEPWINDRVSTMLGIEVRLVDLGGTWARLAPVLEAGGIRILAGNGSDQALITVDNLSAELDLLASARRRQLVWRELSVGEVNVSLTEDAGGRWTVGGLELAGEPQGSLDGMMDVLFYSRYIRIDRVTVALAFYSGVQTRVHATDILVENSGDFHRAIASVALEEKTDETARLVLEGLGDPHDYDNFDGRGYLQLKDVNFSGSLSALVRGWFPEMAARVGDIDTRLNAEFWFQSVRQGGARLVGRVAAAEIPLNWAVDLPPLENFHTELTGWYRPGVDWGLRLQGADADWGDADISPINAELTEKVGERWTEFDVRVDHLNLEVLHGLLDTAGMLNPKLTDLVDGLNPRGNLHNLHLAVDLAEDQPRVQLMANLDAVAIDSLSGAPAARGISGYMQVDGPDGFLELDSPSGFAMLYPQVYEDFMVYDRTRGRIDWRVEAEQSKVLVQSGPISIDSQDGQGTAYIGLDLPTSGEGDPEMTLVVGLRNSHSRYRNHYIPAVLSPALLDWLDSAIGDADIEEAGFIWRGSLKGEHQDRRTIQLYTRIRNGNLAFQEGWLPLRDIDASLVVDGTDVDVQVNSARLGAGHVTGGAVTLRQTPAGNLALQVAADMTADAGGALDILRQSPLAERVGLSPDWQLSGPSRIHADLQIPLAAEDQALQSYRVVTLLDRASFALRDTDLVVQDIAGNINFDLEQGLYSDGLQGQFFNAPVRATVVTDAEATRVKFQGRLAVSEVTKYLGPVAPRIAGATDYRGELTLPVATSRLPPMLNLQTDLLGIGAELPAPVAKPADEAWHTSLQLLFVDRSVRIDANIDDRFATRLVFEQGLPLRGTLGLGISDLLVEDQPGLLVRGRLEYLDTEVWRQLLAGPGVPEEAGGGLDSLAPRLDVRIAELVTQGFSLGNSRVWGQKQDDGWALNLDSGVLAGEVLFFDDGSRPLTLRLDHLRLPQPEPREGEPGFLDSLDPHTVPALDFSTRSLSIGAEEYGSLAFLTTPDAEGVEVTGIQGTIKGVVIGEQQEQHPTMIQWRSQGDSHQTFVSATLRTGDIGDLLELWGSPRVIDSKKAAFSIDMLWPDKPWKLQPATLQGYIGLNLEKGNFYKSPGGAANALIKMVGLFNFDTWLRRLRFDFSDFFSSGVSYDQIRGGLAFQDGIMSFAEPLQTDMTSGKMRMLGRADLINELIDARLIATMPVGTNLPWMAALVGGLPAAAGVYLTSKLFKKEVDKLSSISYRVTGSWDEPELRVDRIFSDKTDFSPAALEDMAKSVTPDEEPPDSPATETSPAAPVIEDSRGLPAIDDDAGKPGATAVPTPAGRQP